MRATDRPEGGAAHGSMRRAATARRKWTEGRTWTQASLLGRCRTGGITPAASQYRSQQSMDGGAIPVREGDARIVIRVDVVVLRNSDRGLVSLQNSDGVCARREDQATVAVEENLNKRAVLNNPVHAG